MLEPLPEKPFFSAYGLTYNHEDFVAEAIESVLSQGWPSDRFEFVLLDDGSTDATPERVKPYLKHMTYVRQENQGMNAAVTRVMGMLKGDVMAPCSGDDMWPPGKVQRVVSHLQENPQTGLVYGDIEAIDEHGDVLSPSMVKTHGYGPHQGQIAGRLMDRNFVSAGAMTMRTSLLPVLFPMHAYVAWEDWWFAWALTNVVRVDFIDDVVFRYRQHGGNFIFGATEERGLDRLQAEIPFRRYMLGNVRPGTASPGELFSAIHMLHNFLDTLSKAGRSVESVLDLSDAERADAQRLAAEAQALVSTAPQIACFTAARALAANPVHGPAIRVLQELSGRRKIPPPAYFDAVRSVTVYAEAEDLVAHPELVRGYAAAFDSSDDVTLLIVAREWTAAQLETEIAPLIELLSGPQAPDATAAPADVRARLIAFTRADCVLGLADLAVPGVEHFTDVAELRAFVEHRLRFPRLDE
ncbi:glycosyltransferase [Solirubrobacter taibaiensis]|nr:glycosyltransferase [Solirubrobacter taibaiensis]